MNFESIQLLGALACLAGGLFLCVVTGAVPFLWVGGIGAAFFCATGLCGEDHSNS